MVDEESELAFLVPPLFLLQVEVEGARCDYSTQKHEAAEGLRWWKPEPGSPTHSQLWKSFHVKALLDVR